MFIDLPTIHSLELIQNLRDARSKDCLFGLLNQTCTPMGSRFLRCNILQPPTSQAVLENRYNAVEELSSNEGVFTDIRQALKSFQDIDRVITEVRPLPFGLRMLIVGKIVVIPKRPSLQRWEQSINNVILVRQYVRAIPTLYQALEGAESSLLQDVRRICDPSTLLRISEVIDATINDDITFQKRAVDLRHQRTYAVQSGQNGLLDIARQSYKEANDDAVRLCNELGEVHGLKLDVRYDTNRQLYFTLPKSDLEDRDLPAVFVNAFRKKNLIECQTLDLVKLNQKIMDSHNEVLQMSDSIVQALIEQIRLGIGPLVRISESIATIDMLASFAQVATVQDYCKPRFSTSETLAVKGGRHPIHEKIHKRKFIPNDVYASPQARFQIITGCNMSGKSTYIRSVALITVMAQIGSFVPAGYCSVVLRHELFARLSSDDSSLSNISTFAAEMREMAFILKNVTSRSLVIIDELGRGTSTRDGLCIAIAIAEALVETRALIWFVTHFEDLASVLKERPGVLNLHLSAELGDVRMKMLYRVVSGPVQDQHYGVLLAKVVGLPREVIDIAEEVSDDVIRNKEVPDTSELVLTARKRKLLLGMCQHLKQLQERGLEGRQLGQYLVDLRKEFVTRMSQLDEEEDDDDKYMMSGAL